MARLPPDPIIQEQKQEPQLCCICGREIDMAINGMMGIYCYRCYCKAFPLPNPQPPRQIDKQGKPI